MLLLESRSANLKRRIGESLKAAIKKLRYSCEEEAFVARFKADLQNALKRGQTTYAKEQWARFIAGKLASKFL